jgi:IS4 transposase
MKAKRDESLEEIWAIRREIAKEFDYDPKRLGAHYRRRQKKAGVKLYKREEHLHAAK